MESSASHSEMASAHEPAKAPPWQFSLRSLLIVTTIASMCLAVGIHFAGVLFLLAAIGLSQAALLLSADWLIRPENRRTLAFATAASWIVLGSVLLIIGGGQMYGALRSDETNAAWTLGACLASGGMACYFLAAKRWRSLTQRDRADRS